MKKAFLVMGLSGVLSAPAGAGPLALDCVAARACVANLDAVCDEIDVVYGLEVGAEVGDRLILTTEEGERFSEFRRLADAEGVLVQAAGGALDADQGAGAMTVFADLRFVLTRHSLIRMSATDPAPAAVAISIHGTCEVRQ